MEHPRDDLLKSLTDNRLLAIIRGSDSDACFNTAVALLEAGINILEVSLTTTDALTVISRVAEASDGRVDIGAGTVLTAGQVRDAHDAGARFIVTPCLAPSVDAAHSLGLPLLVGALTPAEVFAAAREGAAAVKLFPASVGGPSYLKALRDPFPDISFVPVGGVDAQSISAYLQAGAVAVGAGSPLTGDAPRGGSLIELRDRARTFIGLAKTGIIPESRHAWTS
ncbi:bifunctional 4-hydroxy-2-oxoglutarate aldolase/2-dehydro-3-deoxy-phosphogluconate aldolase [Pseudarthrobacter oxydans]|uniref:bifunctional 4-hydroxy-2-oxoglutarate aldolase/2-dehydro-3-deoxy-phosphogluconate aldolase n=1 Tax=Pseudarthrobacter oxydans TaxID=1671 RepID=UPI003822FF7F